MRQVAFWVALLLVGVCALAKANAAPTAEGGDWAIYAGTPGPGPWKRGGEKLGVFLVGERWEPQVFVIGDRVLEEVPVGGQGRLVWRGSEGLRKAVNFDPAEVPLRREDMMEGDRPLLELPLWRGRSRVGVLVLLLSMAPQGKGVVELGRRWRKSGELPAGEWARFLFLSGARKDLEVLAKKDGAAAYEVVGMSLAAGEYGKVRALLGKKAVAARVDEAVGGGQPWSQLLLAAALHGLGKDGEARRVLSGGEGKKKAHKEKRSKKGKRKKGQEEAAAEVNADKKQTLVEAALAGTEKGGGPEVLRQESPIALALRVPGFREVLESLR
jgi:hypothetical protein